ncbi:MAG: hypothetical protein K2Y37_06375 [Pirellulales bacterium]|nr:hypothetical protein [Pirellulales bacterium]
MSECQYVEFRAIDAPVSDKNQEYMRKQSTRAEITPWSFQNEYHFGDFRGKALEMLRRGYDVHLHYANFGIRKLMMRLPSGLPDARAAALYLDGELLTLHSDKQGDGATLEINPDYEPGDLDDLWDLDEWLERLLGIRAELIEGDLRPLYLARLAVDRGCYREPEAVEPPVPAGLASLSSAQAALAEFYGIGSALLAAVAKGAPPLPPHAGRAVSPEDWLRGQPQAQKDAWLAALLTSDHAAVRSRVMKAYRDSQPALQWPVVDLRRTMDELAAAAKEIERARNKKAAQKREQQRQARLAKMAADPAKVLQQVDELVSTFSSRAYDQASDLLAELREARPGDGAQLAESKAQALRAMYPTKNKLVAALRKRGLLAAARPSLAKASNGKRAR